MELNGSINGKSHFPTVKVNLYSVLQRRVSSFEGFERLKRDISKATGLSPKTIGKLAKLREASTFRQIQCLALIARYIQVNASDLIEFDQTVEA